MSLTRRQLLGITGVTAVGTTALLIPDTTSAQIRDFTISDVEHTSENEIESITVNVDANYSYSVSRDIESVTFLLSAGVDGTSSIATETIDTTAKEETGSVSLSGPLQYALDIDLDDFRPEEGDSVTKTVTFELEMVLNGSEELGRDSITETATISISKIANVLSVELDASGSIEVE